MISLYAFPRKLKPKLEIRPFVSMCVSVCLTDNYSYEVKMHQFVLSLVPMNGCLVICPSVRPSVWKFRCMCQSASSRSVCHWNLICLRNIDETSIKTKQSTKPLKQHYQHRHHHHHPNAGTGELVTGKDQPENRSLMFNLFVRQRAPSILPWIIKQKRQIGFWNFTPFALENFIWSVRAVWSIRVV